MRMGQLTYQGGTCNIGEIGGTSPTMCSAAHAFHNAFANGLSGGQSASDTSFVNMVTAGRARNTERTVP